jgi:putative ABC transport system substrate-binding protein
MRRRGFVTYLGSALVAFPLAARAQQAPMPVIGFLNGSSPQGYGAFVVAFRQGLSETGYTEGRNVAIEYHWAEGHYERLPALAADLVRRQVAVIAATSTPANTVAKKATSTIPIVFTTSSDPIKIGLVPSLARPGGNVTGVVTLNVEVASKRLALIGEMVPAASTIGVLVNATNLTGETQSKALQAAARSIGRQIVLLSAATEGDIDAAFARLSEQRIGALFVESDAFLFSRREQLAALAKRYAVATIFDRLESVEAGGLMSYGGSVKDVYRLAGIYAGRILKGEKPADLPVVQSTKLELVINLKTAKALGITVPVSLLQLADEVIQ